MKKFRQIIQVIFPPARRPVRWWHVLPLALFLLIFIGGCAALEMLHVVTFVSPVAFLLLLVTPWFWWAHETGGSGLRGGRAVVALMIRLIIVGAFIMLLAEPRAVRENKDLSVVYALDLSDSIGDAATDQALSFIAKTVTDKPQQDRAGMVVFGANAAVELPPRITFLLEAINSRVAKDATNLEKGLSLAATMLPEEMPGRVVLISDGTATEGNMTAALDLFTRRQAPVDVLPIQYQYDQEVWLEKIELPRFAKSGETYEAAIILSSLQDGSGILRLHENERLIFEQEVTYQAGKNRFTLPLYLRTPGYYEYVARIDPQPGTDGRQENNSAIGHIYLHGEGRILLVIDGEGDRGHWEPLVKSLQRGEREVEVLAALNFPRDIISLLPYDCVIFNNVGADMFDEVQMTALKNAVHDSGMGFLMIGGRNSFGPGGYHMTPVEEALPVTMDVTQRRVMPKGALVIVLHTCEFAQGNDWGKRIAKEAIRVLGAKDEVGVLVYDSMGGEKWLFKLTPAEEFERLFVLISQAQIGDMPTFATTMQMGLTELQASKAAAKHMIIISDGDPSPPPPTLLQSFIDNNISVSTVSINPHGGQDVAIMETIAAATGGRNYSPGDPSKLPSIFIKEAKTLRKTMIYDQPFDPRMAYPSPILKEIDAVPELKGFVLTTGKPQATVILRGPEEDIVEPILATWRYGIGKTAAFTSDLGLNWGKDWVAWEKYDALVKQMMIDISRTDHQSDIYSYSYAEGSTGTIVVEDHSQRRSMLQVEASVTGPSQRVERVTLEQVGPGRYQAEFPLWGKGRYGITAMGVGDGRSERSITGFAVAYSPEYLRFRSTPSVLEHIAKTTGGRLLSGSETSEDIFPEERMPRRSSRPIFEWFLLGLALLVPLDVGARRVQLDWMVIRSWFGLGRKRMESDKTLGALLKRKREIKFTPGEGETARHFPTTLRPRPTAGVEARPKPPPPPETKPEETQADGLSTTERLLKAKKHWKQP